MRISRREIEKRYRKLIENIENAKIYDGRGTYDEYICRKCGKSVFTTYKDKGVTPFTMPCCNCKGGVMYHEHTYNTKPNAEVKQWIRPTLEQVFKLHDEGTIQHVLDGGLLLEESFHKK